MHTLRLRSVVFSAVLGAFGLLLVSPHDVVADCQVSDNGSGVVKMPPEGCGYLSPSEFHAAADSLPLGTELVIDPIHFGFVCGGALPAVAGPRFIAPDICPVTTCTEDGTVLVGTDNRENFCSKAKLRIEGTGVLAGFRRTITMPLLVSTEIAALPDGSSPQTFATVMAELTGDVGTGDPDFESLTFSAGNDQGHPSTGSTTLTQLPSGQWRVDSVFDVEYQIAFVGRAGSPLDGFASTTVGTVHMEAQRIRLTKPEARCVVTINKHGASIVKARLGTTAKCIKNAAASFPTTVSTATCNADDSKGKVATALGKIAAFDTAKCVPNPPSFGYTDAATVGGAAVAEMNNAVTDLFGAGPTVNTGADVKCLVAVEKRFGKAMDASLKEFIRCKQKGLKPTVFTVLDATDLGNCIGVDPTNKVQNAIDKMGTAVDQCALPGPTLSQIFPGCAPATAADLKQCLTERLKCRSCLAAQAWDDVDGDCDLGDNGALDASCTGP